MDPQQIEKKQCAESGSPARPPEWGVLGAQPPGKKKSGCFQFIRFDASGVPIGTKQMASRHMILKGRRCQNRHLIIIEHYELTKILG